MSSFLKPTTMQAYARIVETLRVSWETCASETLPCETKPVLEALKVTTAMAGGTAVGDESCEIVRMQSSLNTTGLDQTHWAIETEGSHAAYGV